ncbi:hypothetical protein ACIQXV_02795 [Neobacillus sp. NPDC097160]
MDKQTSKIAKLLGRPQPQQENIFVGKNGVIVVVEGELNLNKLVNKALAL